MDPENYSSETSSIENKVHINLNASKRSHEEVPLSPSNTQYCKPEKVIKIAEIQRINIDQFNVVSKSQKHWTKTFRLLD